MPLSTKVRWKMLLIAIAYCLSLNQIQVVAANAKCDKTPGGQEPYKMPGDNGFSISVSGSPTLYRPGQVYTITLEGLRTADGSIEPDKIKFIDFMLVAESDLPATELPNLGTFQLMPGDAMSKFSHRCNHAVQATSALPKEIVQVLWTAPEEGSGCINLRAMIVERRDVWYMDDGALSYVICEDNSPLANSPIVEPCCACDEAKYEVIFEGLWSRHTHPKDYPVDEWQTQFSNVIGASHSIDYELWKYGELASPALSMLGVSGSTKKLEIDMKRHSKNIRSVIKARGLHQRSNVEGWTFAVFRMDSTNHLLSLVSKLIPSPDWIVGLSMENLCLANCSWVQSRVIDLYPWDVGVQSGVTYQDPGQETHPREIVRRITSCNPDDEDSPFYDQSCTPLKPVARLHILKQREYKKQCPNGGSGVPLNPSWGNPTADQVNNYGETDIYTGTGIGPTTGENEMDPGSYYASNNGAGTYNDYAYQGSSSSYSGAASSYSDSSSASSSYNPCSVSEWSEWTSCSQTCGRGSHSRTRTYLNPTGAKITACKVDLFDKNTCHTGTECPQVSYRGAYDPFFTADELGVGGSRYNAGWSSRGLSSHNLKKDSSAMSYEKDKKTSYLYSGTNNNQGNVHSYVYGSDSVQPSEDSFSDPYYDPYDKLSGYVKQKGYPPKTNKPGSSRYNPYKELGYYGYTFGGYTGDSASFSDSEESDLTTFVQRDEDTNNCEVTDWGHWSDCSTKCGEGTRSRSRFYSAQQDTSTCSQELYQVESCYDKSGCLEGQRSTQSPDEDNNRVWLPTPEPRQRFRNRKKTFTEHDPQCAVANWSEWSPCSVTCGHGYSIRTRVYSLSFVPNRICDGVRLQEKRDCRPGMCWTSRLYNDDAPDYDMGMDNDFQDPVAATVRVLESKQTTVTSVPDYCHQDPDPGACRTQITRWYYDPKDESCKTYKYTGCGGNRNSFDSEDSCMDACHPPDNRDSVFKSLMPMSLTREDYLQDQQQQPLQSLPTASSLNSDADCQMVEWSEWSDCSASCGRGWKTKTREVLVEAKAGGRPCPRKLKKKRRCREVACPPQPANWYNGNWQMLQATGGDV